MKAITIYDNTGSGLFGYIKTALNVSWFDDTMAGNLNKEYFLWHSGMKDLAEIWSLIYGLVDDDTEDVGINHDMDVGDIDLAYETMAGVIVGRYGTKWKAKYELLTKEYDLSLVDTRTRIETPNIQRTDTPDLHSTTETSGSSDGHSNDTDVTSETEVSGFNSSDYSPASKTTGSSATATGETHKDTTTLTQQGTRTTTEKGTRETVETHTKGNITDEIRQALILRDTMIHEIILTDVDYILTSPYYS